MAVGVDGFFALKLPGAWAAVNFPTTPYFDLGEIVELQVEQTSLGAQHCRLSFRKFLSDLVITRALVFRISQSDGGLPTKSFDVEGAT